MNCKNYIGFEYIGHWDESIIKKIYAEESGDLIDSSLNKIRRFYSEPVICGGGEKKITDKWIQLTIELIDGICIKVACQYILWR